MHVWMPTNKMWVLARPPKNNNTADISLKRGRERFEQPSAGREDQSDASRRPPLSHARDAVAKRQRAELQPDVVGEPAQTFSDRVPASPSPLPGDGPSASVPPEACHAASADGSHNGQLSLPTAGSPRAAQESNSDAADAGARPFSRSAAQALRVAVAAGEREGEHYTGFELAAELTQEQLAEAAEELYEPLPTCPICAFLLVRTDLCHLLALPEDACFVHDDA